MNVSEFKQGIQKAKRELLASLQSEGAKAGADAAALVENRIVTKGEKKDGGKLSPYSTKPVAAFRYFGKSRNSSGESAVRAAAKAKQGVSYKQFREMNGLNTGVKNLQFTGEMFRGFGLRDVKVLSRGIVQIEIGGKNARSNLLLGAHSERENTEITAPSKEEIDLIVKGIEQRVLKIIERNI